MLRYIIPQKEESTMMFLRPGAIVNIVYYAVKNKLN